MGRITLTKIVRLFDLYRHQGLQLHPNPGLWARLPLGNFPSFSESQAFFLIESDSDSRRIL